MAEFWLSDIRDFSAEIKPVCLKSVSSQFWRSNARKIPTLGARAYPDNILMALISKSDIGEAIATIGKMDNRQRERLADEIHAHQPQLLASVLAQQTFGASLEQIEVLLNLLMVSYQSMKVSGHAWHVVTEEHQERCLARFAGRIRFLEGHANEQKTTTVSDVVTTNSEQWLLAFVSDELRFHGLMLVDTDTKKFLVLAALGMVECIAEAGSLPA